MKKYINQLSFFKKSLIFYSNANNFNFCVNRKNKQNETKFYT